LPPSRARGRSPIARPVSFLFRFIILTDAHISNHVVLLEGAGEGRGWRPGGAAGAALKCGDAVDYADVVFPNPPLPLPFPPSVANPGPLGLFAFALTTALLQVSGYWGRVGGGGPALWWAAAEGRIDQ
jgi:hypothetical protein